MHSTRRNDKRSVEKDFLDLATTDLVQLPVLFRVSFIPFESRTVRKLIGKPRHSLYITSIYERLQRVAPLASTGQRSEYGPVGATPNSARAILLAAIVVIGTGCTSNSQPASAGPGAHIWFESSVELDVRDYAYFDSSVGPGLSTCRAWSFSDQSLTDDQLAAIEGVTLQPFPAGDACDQQDGYSYNEATVTDGDGTAAEYRDTGCAFLRISGSTAMLPPGFFGSTFPLGDSTPCP
jgi:hypothetical protein